MKKRFLLTFVLLVSTQAFAFLSTGHRLVAMIAYDHLTPHTKAAIRKIFPKRKSRSLRQQFISSSTWADRIKFQGITQYNSWHYVDKPIIRHGVKAKKSAPPNLATQLPFLVYELDKPKLTQHQKLFYLKMLIHLVGDAHQPLHASELYSLRFPYGDKGGNLYKIKVRYARNLHRYWDSGLNGFGKPLRHYPASYKELKAKRKSTQRLYRRIQHAYPYATYGRPARDLQSSTWINESYKIAKKQAYNVRYRGRPSAKYIKQNRRVIKRQIALAGYRLAFVLNSIFDKKSA